MKKLNQIKVDLRQHEREAARKLGRKIPQAPKDLFEPALSENAAYIAKTRYAFRDDKGNPIETPKDLFWRVAYYIAAADTIYLPRRESSRAKKVHQAAAREFYELMATQSFIPNTPTLVNSGKIGQSLSACFVLPVEDDMRSILKTMSDMAMIHKMAGGTGFSFSHLRPKDDMIGTSKGKSTGPVAFMQAYNDVCSQIRQGGVRRGANMGILHYNHPDVLRFAVHKIDEFSLTNFNISVTVTEGFMEQVHKDAQYAQLEVDFDPIVAEIKAAYAIRDLDLKNVRVDEGVARLYELCRAKEEGEGYDLINPRTGKTMDKLNAKRVFDLITKLAWQYGDPGLILIDRVNKSRAKPGPKFGPIEATNPCAEQPLHPYDACTLGSINLSKFVYPAAESRRVEEAIDWQAMKKTIHCAIHFLDNVLDMNEYPVYQIDEMTAKIRRVGLGVMGWADMLVKLGIGYNTKEGFDLAEKVMKFVQEEADSASEGLAKIRGVFPAFKGSIYDKPARRSLELSRKGEGGKGGIRPRNGARTTIAPTGTISLLADCSSGIEPHFALTFAKNTIEGKRLFNTNPYFTKALEDQELYSEELLAQIGENKGSIQNLAACPPELKKVFVVAGDIAPADHVRMEAAFQKFTDNGISKTINFPSEATVEDVREAYWLTYELGGHMITIYRDGSRVKQVLEVKKDKSYYDQLAPQGAGLAAKRLDESASGLSVSPPGGPQLPGKRRTPHEAWGMRVRKRADVGWVYTAVYRDVDGVPVEVFINIGKPGGYISASAEVTGRLISRALKYGATLEEVASDLVGISCGTPYGLGPDSVLSAFDAVGKSLLEIAKAKQLQLPISEEPVSPDNGQTSVNLETNGHTNGYSLSAGRQGNGYTNGHTGNGKTAQMTLNSLISTQVPAVVDKQDPSGLIITSIHEEEKMLEAKFTSCPDCGSPLIYAEGCKKCVNVICGWSKCS